jgi:hypothetical protein
LPPRSQFLTLLCVLTFLSSAIGLFEAVTSLTKPGQALTSVRTRPNAPRPDASPPNQAERSPASPDAASTSLPGAESVPISLDLVQTQALSDLGYNLLTLAGAILMFFGRRVGLYVYGAGIVTKIAIPVILAGSWAGLASPGPFFSLIFAALYYLNWKEMR